MPTFFELANGLKGDKDQANTQNGQGSIFTTHKDNVGWIPPSINRYHPWKHINLLLQKIYQKNVTMSIKRIEENNSFDSGFELIF